MDRRRLLAAALLLPLPAALRARPARGSIVLAMELPDLTSQSDRIVVGQVTSVKSAWADGGKRILSTVEVRVDESWKGDAPVGGKVTIVQPGGVVGNIEMKVHGLPAFSSGERAVLFLRGRARASLVGLGQGKRRVHVDPDSRRLMVEAADRSAAVTPDLQGRLRAALPDDAVPLDDLRAQVRTLLKTR